MTAEIPRERILAIFEKHRSRPGAPYDDSRFTDYLLAEPKGERAAHNSFGGLRRYNAFINEVQYEFAICFSQQDFQASYSLAKFVDRVSELERSRRGSLTSLKNQVRAGPGWRALTIADFVLLLLAVVSRGNVWLLGAILGVALAVNTWFLWFAWKSRTYQSRLRQRIEQRA